MSNLRTTAMSETMFTPCVPEQTECQFDLPQTQTRRGRCATLVEFHPCEKYIIVYLRDDTPHEISNFILCPSEATVVSVVEQSIGGVTVYKLLCEYTIVPQTLLYKYIDCIEEERCFIQLPMVKCITTNTHTCEIKHITSTRACNDNARWFILITILLGILAAVVFKKHK